ncbi:Phosphoglycolate phosphatase, archaeal type [Candidatus Nitrosotalea sp. TS]|uniref:phosphoglycolate phosphatase n=1 Tax=Candidatus Nitrosotalea sp. TS TaxID=2341020 RepID=UPI001407A961|nr:phosphoglycolate phosphatase [Candidatus Nitrosotalea sp. TS]MDE1826449.1 phosphoglycolate phosphatase [Nitrososphaerota archaeon]MDE1872095.1 phosphoglycolate phosphatase [Nitrososphaerota archaeon]NHI02410.1 Phosphoglycolate phosphatase, archaeal type [Candidatus Nitrosotalea sp. TS]
MKPKIYAVDIDGTITDNKGGRVDLDALAALRYLVKLGHKVIYVTGRSSIEAYVLSVFGGTTRIAVGENGGIITSGPDEHRLIGNKQECLKAFQFIKTKIPDAVEKPVFPRITEVVLERNFDVNLGKKILAENNFNVQLSDSMYAYHINSKGVNKANGFLEVMKMFSATKQDVIAIGDSETDVPLFGLAGISVALGNATDDVKSHATITVPGHAGDGIIEALEKIELKLLVK